MEEKSSLTKLLETIFDKIVIIHYVRNKHRKEKLDAELERVGISRCSNLEWYYDIDTPYDEQMFETINLQYPYREKDNNMVKKLAFHHYRIMKIAYEQGCKRILIMEDDVCFLKDLELLEQLFIRTPMWADVVLYDKLIYKLPTEKYYEYFNPKALYIDYSHLELYTIAFSSCACYALSREGMDEIIQNYEHAFTAADTYTNFIKKLAVVNKAKRVFANVNLCIQDSPGYYEDFYKSYIDFDRYNLPSDNPYSTNFIAGSNTDDTKSIH